jgi:hypothetical protein
MSYTIKRTDGTILLTLSNTKVDQLTTSLALIGKNVDSYGEYYNDNLVGLLENFAGLSQPRSPLVGQLWYNKGDGRVYVYGMSGEFTPIVASNSSETPPTVINRGDTWVDPINKQLYFSTDGTTFTLAGPQYSAVSGKSGWIVETIVDTTNTPQVVAALYNKDILLAITSANAFTFAAAKNGMSSVQIGFNLNLSIPGIRFVGTATSSENALGFTPADYLKNTGTQVLNGGLTITSSTQIYGNLKIGAGQSITFTEAANSTDFVYGATNKNLRIQGSSSISGAFTALTVDSYNKRLGIFTETPAYPLDIVGDARIQGSLYVVGTSTYVQSTDLRINDKNIELAWTSTGIYTDANANGGGITLHATVDRTILWNSNGTGWNFNTNTNLTSTASSYLIGGNAVLNSTSLGSVVTSAPGLTRVGVLSLLTVSNVLIQGNTISASTATLITGSTGTLFLSGAGTFGTVDVKYNRITSVATCTNASPGTDAVNKDFLKQEVALIGTRSFSISIDVTGLINDAAKDNFVISYLNKLLPIDNPGEPQLNLIIGSRARVLCTETKVIFSPSPQLISITANTVDIRDINGNTATVVTVGPQGQLTTATTMAVISTATVRQYRVNNSSTWTAEGLVL